jgi:hypothetical protein
MRLHKAPTHEQLELLSVKYASLCVAGSFRVTLPLPEEANETSIAHLPRLVFQFNRKDHGKLRQLIDELNAL